MGWSLLKSLYPEAVQIAKTITGLDNGTAAVKSFRRFIQLPSMYFNEEPFPKNESDERAYRKCHSERGKVHLFINLFTTLMIKRGDHFVN